MVRLQEAANEVKWGDETLSPEVTSLAGAILAWRELYPEPRVEAVFTLERQVQIYGASFDSFNDDGIAALAERLAPVEAGPGSWRLATPMPPHFHERGKRCRN